MKKKKASVLVIGGAGYIGSNMVRTLVKAGHAPSVFDNLSTGHRGLVPKEVPFLKGDLRLGADIRKAFQKFKPKAVMHFAASSLVGESVQNPLKYYENNVVACVELLKVMAARGTKNFIFSSTAATYGEPKRVPIREEDETNPTNPYGQSKLIIEKMLQDQARVSDLSFVSLRYFNACGAHPGGETGECHDPETHIIPNIFRAITGENKEFVIFGDDYDTPDGTCVRDYIHIEDLAAAHLLALKALFGGLKSGIFNLGNGDGYSVKEILNAVERITGKKVKVRVGPRRPGDPARLIADAGKASKTLGWKPRFGLDDIVRSAWEWEKKRKAFLRS